MRDWSMVILAGGRSSRMGRDKCDLLLGEKTFLEVQIDKGRALGIEDILVSGYRGSRCDVPVVRDRMEQRGPLGGLEACFRQVKHPRVLVLCVDVPLVPVRVLELLMASSEEGDGEPVIVKHGERLEPMMGVFPASMADDMVEELEKGRGRMFAILQRMGYRVLETSEPDVLFSNVNDPEEYRRILEEMG